jgi:hypothetical protein
MAGNSSTDYCRLEFINEHKSHIKNSILPGESGRYFTGTGWMAIKRMRAWLIETLFWLFFDHGTFGN